jgi:putative ABC transport system substrate-binding protein
MFQKISYFAIPSLRAFSQWRKSVSFDQSRRRNIIALAGSAVVAWPLVGQAQRAKVLRRIGVLTGASTRDSDTRLRIFVDELARLGWTEGVDVQFESRRGGGDLNAVRRYAQELATLAPDVIFAIGGPATERLLEVTRKVPIVFTIVPDPVGSGFVNSLSRPGGNATGFSQFEYSVSGKWLEILKRIMPDVERAAVLRDSKVPGGIGQLAVLQSVAPTLGIELIPLDVQKAEQIKSDVETAAQTSKVGLIVTSTTKALQERDLIVGLAARHRLPAVYAQREFVVAGGLISYAADFPTQFRSAAGYVDRILKGERPADLPVQEPTKYELLINLKTAKELGLTISPTLLAVADAFIE